MKQTIEARNYSDANGNPAGGFVEGRGISIRWQEGPLGRDGERREPNGAFVEGVIAAAINRMEFYQSAQFACEENAEALAHLRSALSVLEMRTARREALGIEGTHSEESQ